MKIYCLKFLIAAAVLIVSFTGCVNSYTASVSPPAENAMQAKTDKFNEAIMLAAASQQTPLNETYLVGPEDLLDIDAYNVEELKRTVRVNSEGNIALPLVGIFSVKGLTTSDIEKLITKKLDKYIGETVVTVFVKEYKSQRISVLGAVKSPQVFAVTGQRYLIDMLLMSGGILPEAGNICYVIRPTFRNNPNSKTATVIIDLDELLENGNFALNIPVFSGDVINVPKGGVIFIDGAVNSPGAFSIRGKMTLVQAITMAKGVTGTADLGDVRIFRENRKGEKDVITVDYNAMRSGEKPDMPVAENDIIIVAESGIKNFFNGFAKTVRGAMTFGGMSVGL
jgi:polysaccharide biosynthesis/export protein